MTRQRDRGDTGQRDRRDGKSEKTQKGVTFGEGKELKKNE